MRLETLVLSLFSLSILAGCGETADETVTVDSGSPSPSSSEAGKPATGEPEQLAVSNVSMTTSADLSALPSVATESPEGTAEWALNEITRLRAAPMPTDSKAVANYRRDRNKQIVNLATQVVAATHADSELEDQFNAAVHQLMETKLELALLGQPDDIDSLFETVRNLEESHPGSKAAEEAGFTLARYAHANARRFAAVNPETLVEFSRQARIYADMYPKRVDRGAPVLFAAARSCENQASKGVTNDETRSGLINEAKLCYTALKSQFPDAHQGVVATAVLRRLNLTGQKLTEFSGPTLDGRFVSIERLRGRIAVIVFWSSENEQFSQNLGAMKAALARFASAGAYLVGVNMDVEAKAASDYTRKHQLPGTHIFFGKPDQQRWDNPIVRYWGIQNIPSIWIVGPDGTVQTTDATFENLNEILSQLATK